MLDEDAQRATREAFADALLGDRDAASARADALQSKGAVAQAQVIRATLGDPRSQAAAAARERALELAPDDVLARYLQLLSLPSRTSEQAQRGAVDMLRLAEAAVADQPQSPDAQAGLAFALSYAGGRGGEALAAARRAIELVGDHDPWGWLVLIEVGDAQAIVEAHTRLAAMGRATAILDWRCVSPLATARAHTEALGIAQAGLADPSRRENARLILQYFVISSLGWSFVVLLLGSLIATALLVVSPVATRTAAGVTAAAALWLALRRLVPYVVAASAPARRAMAGALSTLPQCVRPLAVLALLLVLCLVAAAVAPAPVIGLVPIVVTVLMIETHRRGRSARAGA